MSADRSPTPDNLFSQLASIVGLLTAALFFTGWIYRWAYYGFFQLNIITLKFPAGSFLIVPIQVFFGDFGRIVTTIAILILTTLAIYLTLGLTQKAIQKLKQQFNARRTSRLFQPFKKLWNWYAIAPEMRSLLKSFLSEAIAVVWILLVLFWSARFQGTIDARRDATYHRSSLPAIALITPVETALGRKLDDVFIDPPLEGFQFIGDKGLFDVLRGREDNDTTNPDEPRVWHLLLEQNGWTYLFPALPPNAESDFRPPIVAVRERGQIMILSPKASTGN